MGHVTIHISYLPSQPTSAVDPEDMIHGHTISMLKTWKCKDADGYEIPRKRTAQHGKGKRNLGTH